MLDKIKRDTLRLMFTTYHDDFATELPTINDNEYGSYMAMMDGSIVRALNRVAMVGLSPLVRVDLSILKTLNPSAFSSNSPFLDTSKITNFYKFHSLILNNKTSYYHLEVPYHFEGRVLVSHKYPLEQLSLIYYRKPPLESELNDTTLGEYDIDILNIVPYFVRGELLAEENPQLAGQSMAMFETYLQEMKLNSTPQQTRVNVSYRDDWR